MFIARKGSWNRTEKFGYDVVNVRLSADGKSAKLDAVPDGFHGSEGKHLLGPARLHCASAGRLAPRVG
jgi:hypothetical protein